MKGLLRSRKLVLSTIVVWSMAFAGCATATKTSSRDQSAAGAAACQSSAPPTATVPGASGYNKLIDTVGPTMVNATGELIDTADLAGKQHLLVYFSAHWCGPCRRFTPKLAEFYNTNQNGSNFDVLFVSFDHSENDMYNYMRQFNMNWFAVPHPKVRGLAEEFGARGIPHLVLLDPDGQVVSSSVVNGRYVGPNKVLEDLRSILHPASI